MCRSCALPNPCPSPASALPQPCPSPALAPAQPCLTLLSPAPALLQNGPSPAQDLPQPCPCPAQALPLTCPRPAPALPERCPCPSCGKPWKKRTVLPRFLVIRGKKRMYCTPRFLEILRKKVYRGTLCVDYVSDRCYYVPHERCGHSNSSSFDYVPIMCRSCAMPKPCPSPAPALP